MGFFNLTSLGENALNSILSYVRCPSNILRKVAMLYEAYFTRGDIYYHPFIRGPKWAAIPEYLEPMNANG